MVCVLLLLLEFVVDECADEGGQLYVSFALPCDGIDGCHGIRLRASCWRQLGNESLIELCVQLLRLFRRIVIRNVAELPVVELLFCRSVGLSGLQDLCSTMARFAPAVLLRNFVVRKRMCLEIPRVLDEIAFLFALFDDASVWCSEHFLASD